MRLKQTESEEHRIIFAKIIHNNSFSGAQKFIVKTASSDIESKNVVVSNNGFLLGILEKETGGFGTIQSLSDTNSNIPVRLAGTEVFGFLQGMGNGNPELKFLSDGEYQVLPDSLLITSGINGNFPENIPVGRVKSVNVGEIKVQLFGDLASQESVQIWLFDKNGKYK